MVICLERDADLHMAQLMPLPLTVSCFSKIQIGFTFLVLAHPGGPGKGPLNMCVCVCLNVVQVCELSAESSISVADSATVTTDVRCNSVHTFHGGSTQKTLTRSRLVMLPPSGTERQLLACAGDEASLAVGAQLLGMFDWVTLLFADTRVSNFSLRSKPET